MMDFFSALLTLSDRQTLVVGATPAALRHARLLTESGARVTLVDPDAPAQFSGAANLCSRAFMPEDLVDCWLAVIATSSDEENSRIAALCEQKKIFCNVANNAQAGSFHVPATDDRSPLHITTSTGETASQDDSIQRGFVSLVGAGPGDPDLLTFKALRLIQSADVLVYDRLVSPSILQLRRNDSELIYAGKAKADHALPQTSINQLLVDLARQGKQVVRLKGGDPFIFGRGGEEIETLAQHQISFQVVPGITAASGCAAMSGIPLTHRDHAQSCVFVTGHLQNGQINLNWQHLADPAQTIVVYMGLSGLTKICESLIEHGRSVDTPAALVEQGTTPDQRVHTGTLATLPALIASRNVRAPTLLIIGGVVSLREKLQWFEPSER